MRASQGIVAILAVVVVGWMSAAAAAAADPGVPEQIAIADGPGGVLLGMLDSNGNLWAKYLDSSGWTLEYGGGQTQMAVAELACYVTDTCPAGRAAPQQRCTRALGTRSGPLRTARPSVKYRRRTRKHRRHPVHLSPTAYAAGDR